jgi:Putative Flp pilus-assembly TadE/G-like
MRPALRHAPRRTAGPEDRGSILVITAMAMVAIVTLAAVVVDLGSLRLARRSSQGAVDFAATAGASGLNPDEGGTAREACARAWAYLLLNATDFSPAPSDPCGSFPDSLECTAGAAARSVSASAGSYIVRFVTPVPDGNPIMDGRHDSSIDGLPCQRFGVQLTRAVPFAFGPVVGQSGGTTTVHAVARLGAGKSGTKLFALLILETEGCSALVTSGQASIRVRGTATRAGEIGVDTSATRGSNPLACRANKFAVDPSGTGNSSIVAEPSTDGSLPGQLSEYALATSGAPYAYDPNDVALGILSPRPSRLDQPFTRSPVDWRYNCRQLGRDGVGGTADDCADWATTGSYIDNLDAAYASGSSAPSGFATFPRAGVPTDVCSQAPGAPDPDLPPGNWYVDCSTFDVKSQFTFEGGNVVFRGDVTVATGSRLTINANGAQDAWVVIRNGSLDKDATGSLDLRHAFVYLKNGHIALNAGSGSLRWDAPNGGNFEDLALWSESTDQELLGGQASLALEGVFFTPNADPFTFSGQAGQFQARAQFITRRLEATGQGTLVMSPDPDRAVLVEDASISLIR